MPMYDAFAPDYDRFVNWPERLAFELPLIDSFLKTVSPQPGMPLKILDAACGTGQHAIALSQRGYSVSAADMSAPMIESARSNASKARITVDFKVSAFGELTPHFEPHSFDAVLCLGNSLPHLLTPAEVAAALKDFAACLRPGGLLLIQNRNFDAVVKQQQRWMDPQSFTDGQTEWLFLRFYDFEASGLIRFNIVTLKRPRGGEWFSKTENTFLAPQLSSQLIPALAAANFTRIQAFGSLSGDIYQPEKSPNLVLIGYIATNK